MEYVLTFYLGGGGGDECSHTLLVTVRWMQSTVFTAMRGRGSGSDCVGGKEEVDTNVDGRADTKSHSQHFKSFYFHVIAREQQRYNSVFVGWGAKNVEQDPEEEQVCSS